MTAPFGMDDYEPEDSWDASDSRKEHTANLIKRLHYLNPTIKIKTWFRSQDAILDQIEFHVLDIQRRGGLSAREQLRVEHLLEDINRTGSQP